MKISRDMIRFMYFQMCLYYVLHVITLLGIIVTEKYINLEKFYPFKKNRRVSEHAQHVCKDTRGVMKIMTLNQKNLEV